MFQVIPVHGHYEIYYNGNFICSVDSLSEAEKEIKEYEAAHTVGC